jgi:PAS domain S-box-containing protein
MARPPRSPRRRTRPRPDAAPSDSLSEQGERHLRDFLKNARYLIQSTDMQGRLLWTNDTWQRTLGYDDADLEAGGGAGRGLTMFDLLADESRPEEVEKLRAILAGRDTDDTLEMELCLVAKDGHRVTVAGECDCRVVDGVAVATRGIFRDVSAQREAEARARLVEAQHQAVVDVLDEGIAIIASDATVTLLNPSAERLLGLRAKDVVGRRMLDWPWHMIDEDGGELPLEAHPALVALHTRQPQTEVILGVRRADTGEPIWVAVNARPLIRAGNTAPYAAAMSFRDVTAARGVARLKNELIAMASHELRTPLTAIRGAMDLMRAGGESRNERDRMLVGMASRNAERLDRLISDLMDVERIESGVDVLKPSFVSVHRLLDAAAARTRARIEQGSLTLRLKPAPVELWVDSARVEQVLVNLIGNAANHAPSGSTISLSVRDDGDEIHVAVHDEGRGIPRDKLETIFEPFVKVDGGETKERGAGLGLFLCRAIVTRHGGRIWAESDGEGKGTTVNFTIPKTGLTV